MRRLKKKERISLERGGFLIKGSISRTIKDKSSEFLSRLTYENLTFLLPTDDEYICRSDALLLEFTVDVMKVSYEGQATIMVPPHSPQRSLIANTNSGLNLISIIEDDEKVIPKSPLTIKA